MMRGLLLILATMGISDVTVAAGPEADWRQSGSAEAKLKNLVEVLPSAANIMIEMGERYQNLYGVTDLSIQLINLSRRKSCVP